jgi:putative endonuclease
LAGSKNISLWFLSRIPLRLLVRLALRRGLPPGRIGEELAILYFRRRGFLLLVQNWRCVLGELDLVFCRGSELVFVEVKTRVARRDMAAKYLFDSIHPQKQRRLRLLAELYLKRNFKDGYPPHRLDVLGVVLLPGAEAEFHHLIAAV